MWIDGGLHFHRLLRGLVDHVEEGEVVLKVCAEVVGRHVERLVGFFRCSQIGLTEKLIEFGRREAVHEEHIVCGRGRKDGSRRSRRSR